jgi:hypothetical protein
MTMSSGTNTSVSLTSWLSAPASTSLSQNRCTEMPGEPAGMSSSASVGAPSTGSATLAVSRSIDWARLHGFFPPLTR